MDIGRLLELMVSKGASDLHIASGSPPRFRVDGALTPGSGLATLGALETRQLVYGLLHDGQRRQFEERHELDFAFGIEALARFRCNVYCERGAVAAAIRVLPYQVRSIEDLGLPLVVQHLAQRPKGLVLVTGPTGSGKSTTLAAIVDYVNRERDAHIVTLEDPVEFVHPHKRSLVTQREISADSHSFQNALRAVLRQDPDVVLVGEMRDLETIAAALSVAEAGRLTLGTVHTNSCAQTIHRIVDVFPPAQQDQIRAQLALVLEGVLSQVLVPKVGGGRVLALELLVATPAIRNLIRENKAHQIYSTMQASAAIGMRTMSATLARFVNQRTITREAALAQSTLPDELARMIEPSLPLLPRG